MAKVLSATCHFKTACFYLKRTLHFHSSIVTIDTVKLLESHRRTYEETLTVLFMSTSHQVERYSSGCVSASDWWLHMFTSLFRSWNPTLLPLWRLKIPLPLQTAFWSQVTFLRWKLWTVDKTPSEGFHKSASPGITGKKSHSMRCLCNKSTTASSWDPTNFRCSQMFHGAFQGFFSSAWCCHVAEGVHAVGSQRPTFSAGVYICKC